MKPLTLAAYMALCVALGRAAHAESAGLLALGAVIEEAREHNPEVLAARQRARAAAARPTQASAYDDPTFTYESWNAPESLRVDRADNNIVKLSQKVPFPGKRTLAGTIAEGDAEMARRDAATVERDVVAAVTHAYYDLWMSHQNLLIYARDKDLVQRFAQVAENKYALGQVSQPDVLRAQVERTMLINRVTTQTLAIQSAEAELNALLSRATEEPLGMPEDPVPPQLDEPLDRLISMALTRRPELAGQAAAIGRDEAGIRLARLNYLPDFEFTAERFFNTGQRDGLGAMMSISLPLAYKSKYDAARAEASARLASTQSDLRRMQDRIRREVRQAYLRAQTALEQRALFVTTHIPQAEQSLQATEIGYQTGKIDFLSLIDSVRAIEAVHVEHVQAAADFEKAYADLERAVGGALPRTSTEEKRNE